MPQCPKREFISRPRHKRVLCPRREWKFIEKKERELCSSRCWLHKRCIACKRIMFKCFILCSMSINAFFFLIIFSDISDNWKEKERTVEQMKLSIIIYQFQLNTIFLSLSRAFKKRSRFLLNFFVKWWRSPARPMHREREQHENAKKKSINYQNESHFSTKLLTSFLCALQFNFTFCSAHVSHAQSLTL